MYKHPLTILIIIIFLASPNNANAYNKENTEKKGFITIQTSLYTRHYNPSPEHNNNQDLIAIDYTLPTNWFAGGATFRNSFYQRSTYIYMGKRYELANTPFYARITGGLIHGYRGKYRHKIPLNGSGIAPAILPAIGVQHKGLSSEIYLLGFNAAILTVGYSF